MRGKSKYSILSTCLAVLLLAGCAKKFWDYDGVWVSEEPYFYMPLNSEEYVITELNGEMYEMVSAWENDGTKIYFYDNKIGESVSEDTLIWEAEAEVKGGKLYLTITKDHVSDYEGETIVLEQQPAEDD